MWGKRPHAARARLIRPLQGLTDTTDWRAAVLTENIAFLLGMMAGVGVGVIVTALASALWR